jgi:hypothetical protein
VPAAKSRPKLRLKLEQQIELIMTTPARALAVAPLPPEPEPVPNLPAALAQRALDDREPFGRWLIAQRDRGDWIDALADAARKDSRFPKNGSPDDVRKHLNAMQAEGDMFEAIDDAETDWLCC